MSAPGDMSMLDDLSIDELRWLEASEILEFPASPVDSFSLSSQSVLFLGDRRRSGGKSQSARSSKKIERSCHPSSASPSLLGSSPTSSFTFTQESTSSRVPSSAPSPSPSFGGSVQTKLEPAPSQWLYRTPKYTAKSSTSARPSPSSSSLSIHQLPSSKTSLLLERSLSRRGVSTKAPPMLSISLDHRPKAPIPDLKAPSWPKPPRPRSRSIRTVPLLKTIPSELEVTLQPPHFPDQGSSDAGSSSSSSSAIPTPRDINRRRPPSIASTLSSASSSSRPETPTELYDAPATLTYPVPVRGHHRRYASNPVQPPKALVPSGSSSSCPNKSILTRTSSISTKNSASMANKSVKFAEAPTVHYASTGYWDLPTPTLDFNDHVPSPLDDMGIDVDDMDTEAQRPTQRVFRALQRRERPRLCVPTPQIDYEEEIDDSLDNTIVADEQDKESSGIGIGIGGFKRLINFTKKSAEPKSHQKSSLLSVSAPPTPAPPTRPWISGPYALGGHPSSHAPSSPTYSTSSLRSNTSKTSKSNSQPRSLFSSSPSHPTSGVSTLYGTGVSSLENYRNTKNPATRSVRSLSSVKSSGSASAGNTGFKSWFSRIGGRSTS